jgi:hypothetical protein
VVRVRTPVALYILNQKRNYLNELEALASRSASRRTRSINGAAFKLEKGEPEVGRPKGR